MEEFSIVYKRSFENEEFAEKVFDLAKLKRMDFTAEGYIDCKNDKHIRQRDLVAIYAKLGDACPYASTKELRKAGIQPCAYTCFRLLAAEVLGQKPAKPTSRGYVIPSTLLNC